MSKALDAVVELLDLEQIELDIFRGRSPENERRQRVFGGQVAGQALVAAGRTVPDDRPVHSLHAYFIRPGDPTVPLIYLVDRVRDGRSFTTRRVSAVQHGKTIFTLSASFHHPEAGVLHSAPMPTCRRLRSCADGGGADASELFGDAAGEFAGTIRSTSGTWARCRSRPRATRRCAAAAAWPGCGRTANCPTTRCCTSAW